MNAVRGLVGDIGGTNARFAIAGIEDGRPVVREPRSYSNAEHASPEAVIDLYLRETGAERPATVIVAVAGPVIEGAIDFTNSDWELSEAGLKQRAGFVEARLINDFAAQAMGAPLAGADGLRRIGPEVEGDAEAPLVVLGPGTGFGMGALAADGAGQAVLATEGGHVAFAPVDEVEVEIWRWMVRRHGRCSVERILSGPGLYDLYRALAEIGGLSPAYRDQREVQAAAEGGNALAVQTVDRFCRILGSTAGDMALALGARRGVYVTGGVAARLADQIVAGGFRERFEAKGRFVEYMQGVPSFLITERYTALLGAASLLPRLQAA